MTLGHDGITSPMMVRCDAPKMKQVLANLLSNAVKFTPAGGLVTVHLRLSAEGCPIVSVQDTGIGMEPSLTPVAAAIAEADAPGRHGAGLGLPLARQLIELHQGALEIESEPGQGTVVTVALPAERLIAASADRLSA